MIAACGEIVVHHWRHQNLENCDPWHGEMTPWHVDWQNQFPEENQEVVINRNGIKHIADVLSDNKLVIEFQHSPISSKEIREREKFYGNMIWVVDAKEFKKNMIRTDSVEYLESIRIGRVKEYDERSLKVELDDEISKVEKRIEEQVGIRDGKGYQIDRHQKDIDEITELKKNIESFVDEKLILPWVEVGAAYAAGFGEEFDSAYSDLKQKMIECVKTCKSNVDDIKKLDEQQERITALESIKIEGLTYRKVSYLSVKQARPGSSCAVRKASLSTMFQEVIHFKNNQEILQYEYKQDDFIFAVNPQSYLDSINTDRSIIKKKLANQETIQAKARKEVVGILGVLIADKESGMREKRQSAKSARQEIRKHIKAKRQRLSRLNKSKFTQLEKIEEGHRSSIEEVSKKHANEYYYKWNHERRSWRFAKRPVFLDLGRAILHRVSHASFREIDLGEFIEQIRSKGDCQSIN